jgi:hypothetical protein
MPLSREGEDVAENFAKGGQSTNNAVSLANFEVDKEEVPNLWIEWFA